MRTLRHLAWIFVLGALAGCEEPEVDCFMGAPTCNGTAITPAGTVRGTVRYLGPRPECDRDADGAVIFPIHPRGKVDLFMSYYESAPGILQRELVFDAFSLPAREIFPGITEEQCMPLDPTDADRALLVEGEATYEWLLRPFTTLRPTSPTDLAILGVFDHDGDFTLITHRVRFTANRGDVTGGAYDAPAVLTRVHFDPVFDHPNGQVVPNVDVALTNVVDTERPMFRIADTTKPLSAAAVFSADPDGAERQRAGWALTETRIELISDSNEPYLRALEAGGIAIDFDPRRYSWFHSRIDTNADGMQDPHPLFGMPWFAPATVMFRAKTPEELAAGIPDVALVPTVRHLAITKLAVRPSMDILVPPMAVIVLPGAPNCFVGYVAPDQPNGTILFEEAFPIPMACQELPTGRYDLFVHHGVSNGQLLEVTAAESDACVGGRCYLYDPAPFEDQYWAIPNELGSPDEIGADAIPGEQGIEARLTIYDPTPEAAQSCTTAIDPRLATEREIHPRSVPFDCCNGVRHLCGLPICEARPIDPDDPGTVSWFESPRAADTGVMVRVLGPEQVVNGQPTCIPFPMPHECCP